MPSTPREPRESLRKLVMRYGQDLGRDSRRCEALLRDVCSSYKKEIFALSSAVREGIPAELLSVASGVPLKTLLPRFAKRLQENVGFPAELCQWTVESWAYALGLIARKDLLDTSTRCPSCDTAIQVPNKLYGRGATCRKCAAKLQISNEGLPTLVLERANKSDSSAKTKASIADLPPPAAGRLETAKVVSDTIELPPSETAEDLFRQIVRNAVLRRGGLDLDQLQRTRAALGLSKETADEIVGEMEPNRQHLPQADTQTTQAGITVIAPQASVQQRPPIEPWHIRTPEGGEYGPVSDEIIERWIAEGRIGHHSLIWREGWPDWCAAHQVFTLPTLQRTTTDAQPAISPFEIKTNSNPSVRKAVPRQLVADAEGISTKGMYSIFLGLCCCPPAGIILSIVVFVQAYGVVSALRPYGNQPALIGKVNTGRTCAVVGVIVSLLSMIVNIAIQLQSNS